MSSHVSGGVETREGQNKLLPPHFRDMGAPPVPPRGGRGLFLPLPCLHPPHSHGSSSHVPPWVISHSPPPTHMGAHPMSPLGDLPLSTPQSPPPTHMGAHPMFPRGGHESSSHVPLGLPHPLIGDMGAHPMFPIRERNTLCVPPLKGKEDGGCPRVPPLSY